MSLVARGTYWGDLREMGEIENDFRACLLSFSICSSETLLLGHPGELIEQGGGSSNIPKKQGFPP